MEEAARVQVFVERSDGRPVEDAEVELRGEESHRLEPSHTPGLFEGRRLSPGTYELHAVGRDGELGPESREIELSAGHNGFTIVLGREGEPFFYAGGEKVYFEADETAFLLVARGEDAAEIVPEMVLRHGFESERVPTIMELGPEPLRTGPSDSACVTVRLPDGERLEQAEGRLGGLVAALERRGLTVKPAVVVRRGERPVVGLTAELVVRFEASVTHEEVAAIAREYGLRSERAVLYAGNAFLLTRPGVPSYELLAIAQRLHEDVRVIYAEPQLLQQLEPDQFTPNDALWGNLTHLPLINCDDAWQTLGNINSAIRGGSAAITIAVFDLEGVAPNHPELIAPLTDGTSKLVQSFNFNAMAPQAATALPGDHGTQCAGSATAAFNNNLGTAGVAPNCHLIGARLPSVVTGIEVADALIWAAGFNTGNTTSGFPALPARPADVISNSWGQSFAPLSAALRDCFDFLTVYGRGGRGCTVTFSVGNSIGYAQFSNVRQFAAYERNLAVGASININPTNPVNSFHQDPNGNTNNLPAAVDRRAFYNPFGPEMDIVAPSHTAYPPGASTALIDPITSTTRVGLGSLDGCPGAAVCNDYAATFGGTSHACPTVAGAAALVLSVNPALSWVEVRQILRSTAVRIDAAQANPIGQWVDNDGDGVAEFSQWYGFGRLDVDAAVRATRDRLAAPDIVVRENLADTGVVPSGGWHAHSPDIWVRRADEPIPALAYNAEPPHQSPRRGQDNYVFCRVKNVGNAASNEIYVRASITHYPGFEFRYPQEFIPTNRPGQPVSTPMPRGTYLIDEVRINTLAAGADRIVKMTWPQALVPPATVVANGVTVAWHPCLLLEACPHDGPMPAGTTFDIKRDNNIAQRNISILDPGDPASDAFAAIVAGTSDDRGVRSLVIDRSLLADQARVLIRMADPEHMEKLVGMLGREKPDPSSGRSVRLLTKARLSVGRGGDTMVIAAPPGTRLDWIGDSDLDRDLARKSHDGVEALEVGADMPEVELPLRLAPGEFTPLLVAVLRNGAGDGGELRLTQRRGDGELSAGFTVLLPG
jgi:subtilisin family serine protease